MGKTKYSRKTLVGKKKNNTMKKKYPKKQKGKKLKNNKKIKMKKKANKIKRKYSLKVKKQRGGGDDNADVDNNKVGVSCSNCLHRMDTKAIIVSKPNKDGNCPKGFKKEGDFCVSTNIKDETIANIKTTPNAVVTPDAVVTPTTVVTPTATVPTAVVTPADDIPIARPVTTISESLPVGVSNLKDGERSQPYAPIYSTSVTQQSPGNKTNNASLTVNVNKRDIPPIEVEEITDKSLLKSAANKAKKSRNKLTEKINNRLKSMGPALEKKKQTATKQIGDMRSKLATKINNRFKQPMNSSMKKMKKMNPFNNKKNDNRINVNVVVPTPPAPSALPTPSAPPAQS